jgi:enamine deaminase RidA (YjgF/YER057c/UK114 family)
LNKEWESWVPAGNCPCRATVEAKLAAPEYKVEIQIIAAK